MTHAIVYMRPDGWWLAGDGFVDVADAIDAGDEHNWGGTDWKVVPSADLPTTLCAEAWADTREGEL